MTDDAEPPADVTVPDFRGRQALDAWLLGHDLGLLCQSPDPDGSRPLMHGRVVDQRPPPGTAVPRWDVVTLWVRDDPGDLAGVREPRVPPPTVRHEFGARNLPTADRRPPRRSTPDIDARGSGTSRPRPAGAT